MNAARRSVLGALVAAGLAAGGCAGVGGREPVSVNVADLRMGTASVFEQQYFVTLRIQNPSDRDLTLKGVVFELEINDKAFARGTSGEMLTVPRFGSSLVEVETLSTITGILRQLGAVTGEGAAPKALKYRIKGRVYQTGMGSPIAFDDTGELSLGGRTTGESK
ncbi:MAG: LEA type 2 family protein [Burkholderiales bacterium]